jgi:hypothetical protein
MPGLTKVTLGKKRFGYNLEGLYVNSFIEASVGPNEQG